MTTLRKHEYTVIVESPGLRPVLVSVTLSSGTTDIATLHDRIVASHSKRYPTRPSIRFAASDKDGGHVLVDSTGRTVVPRGKIRDALRAHDIYALLKAVVPGDHRASRVPLKSPERCDAAPMVDVEHHDHATVDRAVPRRDDSRRPDSAHGIRFTPDKRFASAIDIICDVAGLPLSNRSGRRSLASVVMRALGQRGANLPRVRIDSRYTTPVVDADTVEEFIDLAAGALDAKGYAAASCYRNTASYSTLTEQLVRHRPSALPSRPPASAWHCTLADDERDPLSETDVDGGGDQDASKTSPPPPPGAGTAGTETAQRSVRRSLLLSRKRRRNGSKKAPAAPVESRKRADAALGSETEDEMPTPPPPPKKMRPCKEEEIVIEPDMHPFDLSDLAVDFDEDGSFCPETYDMRIVQTVLGRIAAGTSLRVWVSAQGLWYLALAVVPVDDAAQVWKVTGGHPDPTKPSAPSGEQWIERWRLAAFLCERLVTPLTVVTVGSEAPMGRTLGIVDCGLFAVCRRWLAGPRDDRTMGLSLAERMRAVATEAERTVHATACRALADALDAATCTPFS